ncbi:MAG: tripartite tricarboxylate transporter substrate-binding protein [Beijerinckiaceae bacterium]|jgi:tripartite-type tricarboxylate transporter receptor subunit TctC|nr:tripartite tricarboxylate transporter substrate-binding protein [Beijerinckiaceae bacterium]
MTHKLLHHLPRAAIAAALLGTFNAAPALAVDFKGKTIEWIIPFKEGGGSDKWARVYVPFLGKALPGSPTVVVKYMPGGGSTTGANFFAQRSRPDGLTILGTSASTQFPYLLGDKKVRYQYKDWKIVLASPTGGVVYVSPALGIKTTKDLAKLKGQKLLYGSQGATSLDLVPLLSFQMMGLNVKPVFGMRGRGPARLAFERGELNLDYQTTSAYLANVMPLVKEGKAIPLFSWGALDDNGKLVRDPTVPDLPHFVEAFEAMNGKKPTGDSWNAWRAFFTAGFATQKMLFLPKGTKQDIVDAYVGAFKKIFADPAFQKASTKRLGVYPQVTGKPAQIALKEAIDVDPKALTYVRSWLVDTYKVKLNK